MFPVTALYALEPESDYLEAALLTVLQVRTAHLIRIRAVIIATKPWEYFPNIH